jgi:hypothetical protein
MPQRSNDFQQLIYLIHHQIDDEAKVTESKLLPDRIVNITREVDIAIEKQIGDYSILVSVECQGRGRVASVEWVEQMIAKHQALPTNKLVLVSQSGFTETALQKAKFLGIELMTLAEAIKADWKVMTGLENIVLCRSAVTPSACFATYHDSITNISSTQLEMDQQLFNINGEELITVKEVFGIFLDMPLDNYEQDRNQKTQDRPKYTVFKLDCPLPKNTFFIDPQGDHMENISLHFIGHEEIEYELINMQNKSFGSSQVSFGKTGNIDKNALISIVENEHQLNSAAIMIKPSQERNDEIIKLRAVKSSFIR